MRFNTKVADLLQALKVAKTSIASRNAIACLMNFKIELDGNELKVSGSDLDSDSKCMIDVNGEEDGGILVDSDKLFRMINAQPKTQIVTLATDDDILNVFTSDGFKATIAGYAVSDYPDDLEGEFDTEFSLNYNDVSWLVNNSAFAVSKDKARLHLNGVYLEFNDNKVTFTATDGHRLGTCSTSTELSNRDGVILPVNIFNNLLALGELDTVVKFSVSEYFIRIRTQNIELQSKYLEGVYPKYKNVIPKNNSNIVTFKRDDMIDAIRRVLCLTGKSNNVKLSISNGNIEVSVRNSDAGAESSLNVPCSLDGESIDIGFNGAYMIEILKKCLDDVSLRMGGALSATTIEEENLTFLLMPLRLS